MWRLFHKQAIDQPVDERAEAATVRWLTVVLLLFMGLIVANSAAILAGLLDQENMVSILSTNGVAMLAMISIWLLMRAGYLKIANFILLTVLYLLVTYLNAVIFRSIRTPNVMAYFALIPLTGLLAGRRNMNRVATLCIVTIVAIFYSEWQGWLIPATQSRSLFDDLAVLFLTIGINTMLLNASIRRVEEKADIIRQTAALLTQSNRELKQSQEQLRVAQSGLEQKVAQRTEELRQNNQSLAKEIEQRQQLLEALAKSEANWRTLAEQVPELIVRIERDQTISFINRQRAGYETATLHNAPVQLIHHQSKYKKILSQAIAQVFETGKVFTYEEIEEIHGEQYWHINRVSAITEGKTIAAAILISTDISEQKRTEAAMYQAQKMESLGVLAGGLAHDFNNLLTVIVMQTTLALKRLVDDEVVRAKLERVIDAAGRATDLTRQMLNYAGRNMPDLQPFDLNELIRGNAPLFSSAIPKNIQLHTALAELSVFVAGDKGQMQQVLMNLILNAADAIKPNNGDILISTRLLPYNAAGITTDKWLGDELESGDYILLEVEDSGCGMDATTLSKVFDPFFTTKVTGRGLGLASVIGIIRSHKGGLQVTSTVGKGTKFSILLPVATSEGPLLHEEQSELAFVGSRELTLVIDDEELVREGIADLLIDANLRVLTAASGAEGIQKFRQHADNLSLVLLDLAMPEMNGEAVFRQLQQIDAQVPVLVMSGHGKDEMLEHIRHIKHVPFIHKPPTSNSLLRTVQENLRVVEHIVR